MSDREIDYRNRLPKLLRGAPKDHMLSREVQLREGGKQATTMLTTLGMFCHDAADEIERLNKLVLELQTALRARA